MRIVPFCGNQEHYSTCVDAFGDIFAPFEIKCPASTESTQPANGKDNSRNNEAVREMRAFAKNVKGIVEESYQLSIYNHGESALASEGFLKIKPCHSVP
jgi:hypothetical protein